MKTQCFTRAVVEMNAIYGQDDLEGSERKEVFSISMLASFHTHALYQRKNNWLEDLAELTPLTFRSFCTFDWCLSALR